MKNYYLSIVTLAIAAVLSSCESSTTPPKSNAVFTDSTLFILSEGDGGQNNARLDAYSFKKDSLYADIISPLGDVGNDIQLIGKRMYVLLENSSKIFSVNPDSVADRSSISFPPGETPYN